MLVSPTAPGLVLKDYWMPDIPRGKATASLEVNSLYFFSDPSVQRACEFLLSKQLPDGGYASIFYLLLVHFRIC